LSEEFGKYEQILELEKNFKQMSTKQLLMEKELEELKQYLKTNSIPITLKN